MEWFIKAMKDAFNFSDRSRRTEYWMFVLVAFILTLVLTLIEVAFRWEVTEGVGILSTLFYLVILVPSISVTIRRLHDIGKSGWWVLISLIPFFGLIVLLVFTVKDSEPEQNKFGPNPKVAF